MKYAFNKEEEGTLGRLKRKIASQESADALRGSTFGARKFAVLVSF